MPLTATKILIYPCHHTLCIVVICLHRRLGFEEAYRNRQSGLGGRAMAALYRVRDEPLELRSGNFPNRLRAFCTVSTDSI